MSHIGHRIAGEARALVGVPFRLHGRCAETGLDCVGLAALAVKRAGHECVVPEHYGLRGGDVARFGGWLRAAGFSPVTEVGPGDLVLARAGVAQFHLMVRVAGGFVHAHAGLRRVVETPGDAPWPAVGVWRLRVNQLRDPSAGWDRSR